MNATTITREQAATMPLAELMAIRLRAAGCSEQNIQEQFAKATTAIAQCGTNPSVIERLLCRTGGDL